MSRYLVARLRSQGGVMSLPVGWYSVALSTQQPDRKTRALARSHRSPAVSSALTMLMQIQGNPEMPDANRIWVLPDNLWAIYGRSEHLTRGVHRVGRTFVASDARPPPWTTLHCLQGQQ